MGFNPNEANGPALSAAWAAAQAPFNAAAAQAASNTPATNTATVAAVVLVAANGVRTVLQPDGNGGLLVNGVALVVP